MLPAARVSDFHMCPMVTPGTPPIPHVGGPVLPPGAPTVMIGGPFAARMSDMATCVGPPDSIVMGSVNVHTMGLMQARQTSSCAHGGVVMVGMPTVLVGGPTVTMAGTADANDANLVAYEFCKFPLHMQQALDAGGGKIVVCRGSVTEHLTDLKGKPPRGWKNGKTWDSVPGAFDPNSNEVVIATTGHGTPAGAHVPGTGEEHGATNLVLHEGAHGIDHNTPGGKASQSPAFVAAHTADKPTLTDYEGTNVSPEAARSEAFAESAARHYGGDPAAANHPNLDNYWAGDPYAPPPPPPGP
jgi:uncharacterized Zn-binding protein involved in type VI secretion